MCRYGPLGHPGGGRCCSHSPLGTMAAFVGSVKWGRYPPSWGHPSAGVSVPIGPHSRTCQEEEWDPWLGPPQPGPLMVPLLVAHGAWHGATLLQDTALGWYERGGTLWLNLRVFERQRLLYCACAYSCVCLARIISMGFWLRSSYTPPAVVRWGGMGSKPLQEVPWPDTVPASCHFKCRCHSVGGRGFPWRLQKGGERIMG